MKLLGALIGIALASPAAASALPCFVGDANETLRKLLVSSGERPIMKLEIETDAAPWPAILIGKPDGTFSIVLMMNGRTCFLAVGHGMAPATPDLLFPEKPP